MWAEVLIGVVGCVFVLGVANFANNNFWPEGLADRIAAQQNWGPKPAGGSGLPAGLPNPLILLLGVTLVMTWLATRSSVRVGTSTPMADNPDAAELAGINTRREILKTYVLMGMLCALGGRYRLGQAQWRDARHRPELRAVRRCDCGRRWDVVRWRYRDRSRGRCSAHS